MILNNTRFGTIEIPQNDVISFPEGLIGFPNTTQFALITIKEDSAFRWLQCVEEPALAFLVADPFKFVPEYDVHVPVNVQRGLDAHDVENLVVLTTAAIPKGEPQNMTLNLAGPIFIHTESRKGFQAVLENDAYTVRHRVFPKVDRVGDGVAA